MTDITHIFGGPWSPPPEQPAPRVDPPDVQLRDAMLRCGLTPPDHIIFDGQLHRFASGTKGKPGKTDKPGWYVAYNDGIPAGAFGCWRAGVEETWRADIGRQLSMAEHIAQTKRLAEAKQKRESEQAKAHDIAANDVIKIWYDGAIAGADHPYLKRKGIQPHGARVTGDGRLMVPLYDDGGELISLQYIAALPDGSSDKKYHPGAQTKGGTWWIGSVADATTVYIAEGFATAATIYETTQCPVIIAYSASGLVDAVRIAKQKTSADVVIVADHDKSGVGQKYADQAAAKYGARVVMPPIEEMDANDYLQAGYDLAALLSRPSTDWLIPADTFSQAPAPIRWQIKRWIQSDALIMVHGPSGGGKTFLVLDWVCSMSGNVPEWFGHKVRHGAVVYLAGEGHHGLRGRVAAWKHHHQVESLNMWLSRAGCDLNTPEGYMRVVDNVRALPQRPVLIVVDTLHRFLAGDENSAQDAKTMLDACGNLMREFGCSVLLVHHTGVSDEAQHRARGSSAWRGALDIEISVVPAKDDSPMQIVQRKSKDAELAEALTARLQTVEIPGWFDEDGEAVTSAVLVQEAESPVASRPTESKALSESRRLFESAVQSQFGEIKNDKPFITATNWNEFTKTLPNFSDGARRKALSIAKRQLVDAKYIEAIQDGYTPTDWALNGPLAGAFLVK